MSKCEFITDGACSGKVKKRLSYFLGSNKRRVYRKVCERHYIDHRVLLVAAYSGKSKVLNKFLTLTPMERLEELSKTITDPLGELNKIEMKMAISAYTDKRLKNINLNDLGFARKILRGLKRVKRRFK